MISKQAAYRGCLLGLAVGDAMGYSADTKTWEQIQEDYGPHGLLGYDLVNGYAEITSHTQLALFSCNGLLIGLTRGQVRGTMAPYVRYVGVAQREWAIGQRTYNQPSRTHCWVYRLGELRRRHCTDTRMVEILNRNQLGSLEEPTNKHDTPASIAAAVAAGMFTAPLRISKEEVEQVGAEQAALCHQQELDRLGAECVALTHGHPLAFLPGAVIAHLISRCLRDQDTPLVDLVREALKALNDQFGREYRQVQDVIHVVNRAIDMAESRSCGAVAAMEQLRCDTGAEVLAGAVYASLLCEDDFDHAMIVAVNHSGRSAAVACIAGAILGARLGEKELPAFYMEGLEIAPVLREMADDMMQGCPMVRGNKLFDGDWDQKYMHGGL